MELLLFKDYFAPKIPDVTGKIHGVYCSPCNFKCGFCSQSHRNENVQYYSFTLEEFEEYVCAFMETSRMFKFTGGEPTMLPEIKDMMRIVKKHHGEVLLDTNGSNSKLIKGSIDEGLIDVLGISIKGLSPEEAMRNAGITNRALCWDNVIDSCNYAYGKTKTILTYVVDNKLDLNDLKAFCMMIDNEIHIDYFKLNSLYGENLPDPTHEPLSREQFDRSIEYILELCPNLKDRLIIIGSFDAVKNKEAIRYY